VDEANRAGREKKIKGRQGNAGSRGERGGGNVHGVCPNSPLSRTEIEMEWSGEGGRWKNVLGARGEEGRGRKEMLQGNSNTSGKSRTEAREPWPGKCEESLVMMTCDRGQRTRSKDWGARRKEQEGEYWQGKTEIKALTKEIVGTVTTNSVQGKNGDFQYAEAPPMLKCTCVGS